MTQESQDLAGEVALVTGASRGIGLAIALMLGRRGATVIGTATSNDGAAKISEAIHGAGVKGEGAVLNVTDAGSIEALMKHIEAAWGAVSVLVNNAGITRDNLLLRMKEEEWDAIMDTNLKSVFRMSKACARGMTKLRKGRIITIASVVGSMGNAGQANYAAAKAGVMGFSRALAREVASRNITVNTVAPGFIDTDMTKSLSDEQRGILMKAIPLARLGQVDDIAHAVAFLASPGAGYMTGVTLHVNGGMYMN